MGDIAAYDRPVVADLMALADTYADTAAVNGIRSAWAQMARATIEGAFLKIRAAETEVRKQDEALIRQMVEALERVTMACDVATYENALFSACEAVTAARLRLEGKP